MKNDTSPRSRLFRSCQAKRNERSDSNLITFKYLAGADMFFIYPMWDSETERLGKRACTPLGYHLHALADLIGFLGLLSLLGLIGYLGYRGVMQTFTLSLWWMLLIPVGLGLLGWILFSVSWQLAESKGFEYDAEAGEARWIENGEKKTFRYRP